MTYTRRAPLRESDTERETVRERERRGVAARVDLVPRDAEGGGAAPGGASAAPCQPRAGLKRREEKKIRRGRAG